MNESRNVFWRKKIWEKGLKENKTTPLTKDKRLWASNLNEKIMKNGGTNEAVVSFLLKCSYDF